MNLVEIINQEPILSKWQKALFDMAYKKEFTDTIAIPRRSGKTQYQTESIEEIIRRQVEQLYVRFNNDYEIRGIRPSHTFTEEWSRLEFNQSDYTRE